MYKVYDNLLQKPLKINNISPMWLIHKVSLTTQTLEYDDKNKAQMKKSLPNFSLRKYNWKN